MRVILLLAGLSAPASAQILKSVPIELSNPQEVLRKKIFGGKLQSRACEILAKDPAVKTLTADATLQKTVQEIMAAIDARDEKTLRDFFNTRIKVKAGHVLSSLQGLKKITGANASVTNYRVAALNSPEGSSEAIECEDTGVLFHPLYGYPLTVGVWLQASGEEEVARIFMELVPSEKAWTIGAWHVQQWTHAGKDFSMWYDLARSEAEKKHKASAYIAADIAAKLLDGGGFVVFPVKSDADSLRDSQMTKDTWAKTIKESFPQDDVVHSSTLFVRGGSGVLVRFRVKEELSAVAIKEHCRSRLKSVLSMEWTSQIVGIRCGYNFPQEDATKEGVLGSMLITKAEVETT